MDAVTLYAGPNNDINPLLGNVLLHPGNASFAANYILMGVCRANPHPDPSPFDYAGIGVREEAKTTAVSLDWGRRSSSGSEALQQHSEMKPNGYRYLPYTQNWNVFYSSRCFRSRKILQKLLRYLVKHAITPNNPPITQYAIAVEGLGKPA